MSLNGKVLMSLVMLAIFAGMVALAMTYPPEARLLPLVIGIPGTLLALAQVGMELLDTRRRADQAKAAGAMVKREIVLLAYMVGLVLAVLVFGFWIAIPVFVAVFLRFHEGESWRLTLGLSVASTVVLYLMFERILGILVHRGFLVDWLAG